MICSNNSDQRTPNGMFSAFCLVMATFAAIVVIGSLVAMLTTDYINIIAYEVFFISLLSLVGFYCLLVGPSAASPTTFNCG